MSKDDSCNNKLFQNSGMFAILALIQNLLEVPMSRQDKLFYANISVSDTLSRMWKGDLEIRQDNVEGFRFEIMIMYR